MTIGGQSFVPPGQIFDLPEMFLSISMTFLVVHNGPISLMSPGLSSLNDTTIYDPNAMDVTLVFILAL